MPYSKKGQSDIPQGMPYLHWNEERWGPEKDYSPRLREYLEGDPASEDTTSTYLLTKQGLKASRGSVLEAVEGTVNHYGEPVTVSQVLDFAQKNEITGPPNEYDEDVFSFRDRFLRHARTLAKQGRLKIWKDGRTWYLDLP